jgi:hypothetical protein
MTAKFYMHVLDEEIVASTELVEASRNYAGMTPAKSNETRKKT